MGVSSIVVDIADLWRTPERRFVLLRRLALRIAPLAIGAIALGLAEVLTRDMARSFEIRRSPGTTLGTAFALMGAGFLLFEARGWRRGESRVCRRCDYAVLRGGRLDRCPECGADLHRLGALAHGVRRRSAATLGVGSLLLVCSVPPLLEFAAAAHLASSRPGSLTNRQLIEAFGRWEPSTIRDAGAGSLWRELEGRFPLPASDRADLSEAAVRLYEEDRAWLFESAGVEEWLTARAEAGEIGPDHQERLIAVYCAGSLSPAGVIPRLPQTGEQAERVAEETFRRLGESGAGSLSPAFDRWLRARYGAGEIREAHRPLFLDNEAASIARGESIPDLHDFDLLEDLAERLRGRGASDVNRDGAVDVLDLIDMLEVLRLGRRFAMNDPVYPFATYDVNGDRMVDRDDLAAMFERPRGR